MNLLLTFESRRRTGESDFVYTKHERKIMKKEGFAEALAQLLMNDETIPVRIEENHVSVFLCLSHFSPFL